MAPRDNGHNPPQNEQVLQARRFLNDVYGSDLSNLVGCAFWCTPAEATDNGAWTAEPIERLLAGLPDRTEAHGGKLPNIYFGVNEFTNQKRSRGNFMAAHVIAIDDVGSRADVEATDRRMAPLLAFYKEEVARWMRDRSRDVSTRPKLPKRDGPKIIAEDLVAKFGEPFKRHETSPGNWQWFYRLSEPTEDRAKYEAVVKAVGGDARDAARYMRLPCGINNKLGIVRQNGGKPFAVHSEEVKNPAPALSIDQWMERAEAEIEPEEREHPKGGETKDEFQAAVEAGLILESAGAGGAFWVQCPGHDGLWPGAPEDLHSQDDGGLAKVWPWGGFKCHHAHCSKRNFNDFCAYIRAHKDARPFLDKMAKMAFAGAAPIDDEPDVTNLPSIWVDDSQLPRMVEEAVNALKANQRIFIRGDDVVRVLDQVNHHATYGVVRSARIVGLKNVAQVKVLLATWANWSKQAKKAGTVPCAVPKDVASAIHGGTGIDLPPIRGIVQAPFLKRDGTISNCAPGFDAETGLWFDDGGVTYRPVLDAECTLAHATEALAILRRPLAEYVFASPLDEAVALAGMLTPLMRTAVVSAPLFAMDAPKMGSGKTLLASSAIALATGLAPSVVQGTGDPRELDKRLNGALLGGKPCILIDNIVGNTWGTPDLCSALTGMGGVEIRPLGTSTLQVIGGTATLYVTGNNIAFDGDVARRSLRCRIDTGKERPDLEKHSFDPVEYVREHRPDLIHAGLTILRAYILAGRPQQGGSACSNYGPWAEIVRDPLMWLGLPDVNDANCAEQSGSELATLLPAWAKAYGTGRATGRRIKDLLLAQAFGITPHIRAFGELLLERLSEETASRGTNPAEDNRLCSSWLKQRKDQAGGGYHLRKARKDGYDLWFVTREGNEADEAPAEDDNWDPI